MIGQTTSYHIGNSLTKDSLPLGVAALAQQQGFDHTAGLHIRCGATLSDILADPEDVCDDGVPEFGMFDEALPNHPWDYVTLQVHPGATSTLEGDLTSASELIDLTRSNPANADTKFYVVSAWPRRPDLLSNWLKPAVNELDTSTRHSQDYYRHLITRLREQTDAEVYMIPVGDVLFDLATQIENDEVPGVARVRDLYRDATHLDTSVGRFIAGVTTYATLFQADPFGVTKPDGFYGDENDFTPELYDAIHEAVRRVVVRHAFANVDLPIPTSADFNSNGMVDAPDLPEWLDSFGVILPADADANANVDGRDFLLWQRAVTQAEGADFNGDNILSAADLVVWQSAFAASDQADADNDGESRGSDFLAWQRSIPLPDGPDANGNGIVEADDLALWRESFGGEGGQGDFNADNRADGGDFLDWQRLFKPFDRSDFDLDRVVGGSDLAIWEGSTGQHQRGDASGNRRVSGEDFLIWQRDFGLQSLQSPDVALIAVPEPAARGLAGLAIGGFYTVGGWGLSRKRRA
ncbi:hypothetical protein OAS39_08720 [Pirellulales bacterium]|nr:hypothetical protein [Pirellulales bacterium]